MIMMNACLFAYNLWNRSATQDVLTWSYVRVLKYLKTVVEAELSQHNPTLKGISATSVREVSSHEPTGSYLSVDRDEQEEILDDKEHILLDETVTSLPAEA
jgi:hypothetical protein